VNRSHPTTCLSVTPKIIFVNTLQPSCQLLLESLFFVFVNILRLHTESPESQRFKPDKSKICKQECKHHQTRMAQGFKRYKIKKCKQSSVSTTEKCLQNQNLHPSKPVINGH
jgi:hypothetical protein